MTNFQYSLRMFLTRIVTQAIPPNNFALSVKNVSISSKINILARNRLSEKIYVYNAPEYYKKALYAQQKHSKKEQKY